jgi:hypothetical protein
MALRCQWSLSTADIAGSHRVQVLLLAGAHGLVETVKDASSETA